MKGGVLNMFLMKQADGTFSIGGLFLCYVFPCITVYAFYLVMQSGFYSDEEMKLKRETKQAKNDKDKAMMLAHYRRQNKDKHSRKKWE